MVRKIERRDGLEISCYYHPTPSSSETEKSIGEKAEYLFQKKKEEIGDTLKKYFEEVKIGEDKIIGDLIDVDEADNLKLEPIYRRIIIDRHPYIYYSEKWINLDYDTIKQAIQFSEEIGKYITNMGDIESKGNIELTFFKPKEMEETKEKFEILEKVLEKGNYNIMGVFVMGEIQFEDKTKEDKTKKLELKGSIPLKLEMLEPLFGNYLGEPYKYVKVDYIKD